MIFYIQQASARVFDLKAIFNSLLSRWHSLCKDCGRTNKPAFCKAVRSAMGSLKVIGMAGGTTAHSSVVIPWRGAKPKDRQILMTVGDTFSKQVRFDGGSISSFALLTGDTNPLHHDPAYAAGTRFGGIIASGAHVTALLTGMVAGHFADKGVNVGLDFSFRFQAPVRLDDLVNMRWTMTGRMPKLSLKGDIITLEGEAVRSDGIAAVSATAHVLLLSDKAKTETVV